MFSYNYIPGLHFLTVLFLYVTSCELRVVWLTLTTVKRHIIESHFKITTVQLTYTTTTFIQSNKFHGVTPQKP